MVESSSAQYRGILKALFFFGSIQILQTIISLIKIKLTSILIGPSGLGVLTLYNSFGNTLIYLVGFGLFNSSIRNISLANKQNNKVEIESILQFVTKIILGASIFVSISMILFKGQIEQLFFDSNIVGYAYYLLIPFLIFSILTNRNNMLIQGIGEYKKFGKSALIASALGLLIVCPLYYFFGKQAIIFSLLASAIVGYLVSIYFKKGLNIEMVFNFNFGGILQKHNQLLKLGFVMMLSSLFGNLVTNAINIYIVKNGSSSDLGLYNAAITITLQYVGLVFVSLSSEFYPRLSAISNDYIEVKQMVNRQIEIVLVVLFPLLVTMQIFATPIVNLFFSSEFSSIVPFIQLSTVAIVFQALAYVISNIPMAMGDKVNLFLFNSLFPGIVSLSATIFGYKLFGFIGLVYALLIVNIFHFLTMFFVVKSKYGFIIENRIVKFIVLILATMMICLSIILLTKGNVYYILVSLLMVVVFYFSYKKCSNIFEFDLVHLLKKTSFLFNKFKH